MGSSDDSRDGVDQDWSYDDDDDLYPSDHSVDSGKDCNFASDSDVHDGLVDGLPENPSQQDYSILTEEDIKRVQEDAISQVSSVLSVSKEQACLLLRHYNWSISTVHENWFSDEESVRKEVGLIENRMVEFLDSNYKTRNCGICFEKYKIDEIATAVCGHPFCKDCWDGYITTSIKDGPGCLTLKCPDPSCIAAIGFSMVDSLVSDVLFKQKYHHYLVQSYVEENLRLKWCPAPDCRYAITCPDNSESYDVNCRCLFGFCWKCKEDAHRPLDCATVAKWVIKNNAESENTNWILAYTKPCPKCKRPIEKNLGCMHMTCRSPCKYEFCWLCLGDWADHHRTNAACNRYRQGTDKLVTNQDEKRVMAKKSLERYTHYYERWAANLSSKRKAASDLQAQTILLVELSQTQCQSESQLKFIIDAWNQIIECRRVLMWTYVYGFYLPENEKKKKELFEYLQGQAETNLERLHVCVEKELVLYFKADEPSKDFNDFRTKLVDLTIVTRNYFENLVSALENDLPDVNSSSVSSKKTKGSKNKAESSKKNQEEVGAKRIKIIHIS